MVRLNLDTLAFDHDDFQELDSGFDFYASQTTLAPDGRRILSVWLVYQNYIILQKLIIMLVR